MNVGVADRNIVAKIYCRSLSTFLIFNLLYYYLVDLVRPGSNDTESYKRVFLQHFFLVSLIHYNIYSECIFCTKTSNYSYYREIFLQGGNSLPTMHNLPHMIFF